MLELQSLPRGPLQLSLSLTLPYRRLCVTPSFPSLPGVPQALLWSLLFQKRSKQDNIWANNLLSVFFHPLISSVLILRLPQWFYTTENLMSKAFSDFREGLNLWRNYASILKRKEREGGGFQVWGEISWEVKGDKISPSNVGDHTLLLLRSLKKRIPQGQL